MSLVIYLFFHFDGILSSHFLCSQTTCWKEQTIASTNFLHFFCLFWLHYKKCVKLHVQTRVGWQLHNTVIFVSNYVHAINVTHSHYHKWVWSNICVHTFGSSPSPTSTNLSMHAPDITISISLHDCMLPCSHHRFPTEWFIKFIRCYRPSICTWLMKQIITYVFPREYSNSEI